MKFVAVIASTLLFVLISQQFTSALPIESDVIEFTTSVPHVEHEKKNVVEMSTEKPVAEVKREIDGLFEETTLVPHVEHEKKNVVEMSAGKPMAEAKREVDGLFEETTSKNVEERQPSGQSTQEEKRGSPFQQQQQQQQKQQQTEEPEEEEKRGFQPQPQQQQQQQQQQQTEEPEEESETEETGDKKKRGEATEEHVDEKTEKVEEHVEEKPEKVEEHVEEKPEKVVEEHVEEKKEKIEEEPKKIGESSFCPESFAKFEDSCLFVGTKGKITGRSGKVSSSMTDSSMIENIPMGADNSCPPGTEHTERGVCQKILTEAEVKAKKARQSCTNEPCIFHSFDMSSTVEMPLETSERPQVESVEEDKTTATEKISKVESQFETTVASVLKS